MTITPDNASSNLPGKPPVVDVATWQAARDELLVREKAHTHEGQPRGLARGPSCRRAGRWARRADLLVLGSDADGVATWGPTSRPVPQWTRPGATRVETLGRQSDRH